MSNFFDAVYQIVKKIPQGKVVTYGDVAKALGSPRASRQVGWALHSNPAFGEIPCHRVLFADGRLTQGFAFGGADVQRALLQNDGVEVSEDYKVDLKKYRWEIE